MQRRVVLNMMPKPPRLRMGLLNSVAAVDYLYIPFDACNDTTICG